MILDNEAFSSLWVHHLDILGRDELMYLDCIA